jgi:hypothetical protein
LPEYKDSPSVTFESFSVFTIPIDIRIYFLGPKCFVGSRPFAAHAIVPMPETAVHENHDPEARKYNVGTSWKVAAMQAVSKASHMQSSPNLKLWLSVLAFDRAHHLRADFW